MLLDDDDEEEEEEEDNDDNNNNDNDDDEPGENLWTASAHTHTHTTIHKQFLNSEVSRIYIPVKILTLSLFYKHTTITPPTIFTKSLFTKSQSSSHIITNSLREVSCTASF
jgi:hypothetical protein